MGAICLGLSVLTHCALMRDQCINDLYLWYHQYIDGLGSDLAQNKHQAIIYTNHDNN